MSIFVILVVALIIFSAIFLNHPQFGKVAKGERLLKMNDSPNYSEGKFQNLSHTPSLSPGYSMNKVLYQFFLGKHPRTRPDTPIPSIKTDLKNRSIHEDILVWFGHSSYYFQLNGKRFLVDPVFSGNASPIKGSNKSFAGSDIYTPEDFPGIDYLLISHDHYDHLDYKSIIALKPQINQIICGLGVGAHFEHWGFPENQIIEKDWNESFELDNDIVIHTTPARHFSGRKFARNNTLWLSFVVEATNFRMFVGGDGGYDVHFSEIGKRFGGFDLAILENGQYNPAWHEIHMLPEETWTAAKDLNARKLLPVHSGKFKLAFHPWDEPLSTLQQLQREYPGPGLLTPRIGQIVHLRDEKQEFDAWWQLD